MTIEEFEDAAEQSGLELEPVKCPTCQQPIRIEDAVYNPLLDMYFCSMICEAEYCIQR